LNNYVMITYVFHDRSLTRGPNTILSAILFGHHLI